MTRSDSSNITDIISFIITDKVRVNVDPGHKRAVILCETNGGKLLQIETGYQTINKIHAAIHNQMEIL